jgi:peroxiredoxin
MKKKTFILIGALIVLLCFTWVILTPLFFPTIEEKSDPIAVHQGFQAPDFSLPSPTGQYYSLSDYEGQPVLVFLWASWCSVCKRTMPGLQSVYEDFSSRGFEILAINTTFQDTLPTALDYFQSQGYLFTMLLDQDGNLSKVYQLHALPTSVLINPEGEVADVIIGSGMSEGYLRAYLETIYGAED